MAVRSFIILLVLAGTAACHTTQPLTLIPLADSQANNSPGVIEQNLVPVSPDTSFAGDNSPELTAALKQFASTGKAPIVKHAGFVEFPFGEVQPVLNCQPSYGCDIELQAGEQVKAVILGNETVWDYLVWESNQESAAVSHITIGPRIDQARTNAIIGTNRRTYHLELLSTTKSDYTRSAKFYYPRERLREFQARQNREQKVQAKQQSQAKGQVEQDALPYQYVSFSWEIDADNDVSWKPVRVFDDGAHIYLQFPENVIFEDFPGVYAPTDNGGLMQPIWRTVKPDRAKSRDTGSYIMVDGMFDELRFTRGFGKKQETVTIRKK